MLSEAQEANMVSPLLDTLREDRYLRILSAACELARNLGISKIIIHKYSSILSAYGVSYVLLLPKV